MGGKMILAHEFDAETHVYKVPGQFVLSTSDIIYLNGLANYDSIPSQVLAHASWRGTQLHKAIQFFEEDGDVGEMPEEVKPYFQGYCRFRTEYNFEPIGEMEKQIVYVHEGTEQAVGCTIDLRGTICGLKTKQPYILDIKTCAKLSGKAKAQKVFAWRMQTQSYFEATACDEDWFKKCESDEPPHRAIVQVGKDGMYEFHDFGRLDDSHLWDSCCRIAMAKLSNGFQLDRK